MQRDIIKPLQIVSRARNHRWRFLFLVLIGFLLPGQHAHAQCEAWPLVGAEKFSAGGATSNSIVIDASGTPYVAYCDAANGSKATVMKYNGISWVAVGAAGFSAGTASSPRMAMDNAGIPYVVFSDGSSSAKATVMKYNGSAWVTVGSAGFSADTAEYTNIAINSSGTPYISYKDYGNSKKATVKKFDGTSWVTVGTAGFSSGALLLDGASLTISPTGDPHVSYADMSITTYSVCKKFDGTSWVNVGGTGFSTNHVITSVIKVDPTGVPYVLCTDIANGYKAVLYKYSAGSWTMVGAPISQGEVQYYNDAPISLAIDASGIPYAAFTEFDKIRSVYVRRYNGVSWETVGNTAAGPGYSTYPSLAFDAAGAVYAAYSTGGVMGIASSKATVRKLNTDFAFISGSPDICGGATSAFTASVAGGTWSSSNTAVATVSSSGLVTGVTGGTALISYATSICSSTYLVTIRPYAGVIAGNTSVLANENSLLFANGVTNGTWSSSNSSVATVTSAGNVTGIAAGTSVISYTSSSACGSASATAVVTIGAAVTPVCSGWIGLGAMPSAHLWTTSLTFDQSGVPYVSSPSGVAKLSGSAWVSIGGPFTEASSDVKVAADGTVYVAYMDLENGGKLSVKKYNGSTWEYVGTPGFSAQDVRTQVKLAINSAGVPFVAYVEKAFFGINSDAFRVVKFDGASWASVANTDLALLEYTELSFALDPAGNPYLMLGNIGVYKVSGTTWVSAGTGIPLYSQYPKLTFGPDGTAFAAYEGFGGITVTKLVSGAWVTVGSSVGYTPHPFGFTVDGTGTPWVSYVNASLSNRPAVAKKFDGTNWVVQDSNAYHMDQAMGNNLMGTDPAGNPYRASPYTIRKFSTLATTLPANSVSSMTVCPLVSTSLTNVVAGADWTSSDDNVAQYDIATATVRGIGTGTATISYSLGASCLATTVVSVLPLATITPSTSTLCTGATRTLSASVSGGTWESTNDIRATVGSVSGIVMGVSAGSVRISYTMPTTGCKRALFLTVTDPPSAGTISGADTVVQDSSISLSSTVTGGTWSISNANATIGSTSGIVTGVTPGTAVVTYSKTTGGCTGTVTKVIYITLPPIYGPLTISGSGSVTLTHSISGGTWSTSCGAIATVTSGGVVTGVSNGLATISYTVDGDVITAIVTVNITSSAIAGSLTVCEDAISVFTHPVSGGTWSSSNTAVGTFGSTGGLSGVSVGTTTISYSYSSGCTSLAIATVNAATNAGTITGAPSVIAGETITFTNAVSGGTWSTGSSNATVGSTGMVTGISIGTATISYSVTGSCGTAVATKAITIGSAVDEITGITTVCAGSATTLSNTTTGGTWISGNSGVATVGSASGIVTGIAAGVVNITYAVSGGTAVASVTVNGLPAVIVGATSVCEGSVITLTSTTTGGTWSSGSSNATVGSAGEVTGVTAGTATISYSLGTGCARTAVVTITEQPGAITGTPSVCIGTSSTLSNSVSGGTWTGGTSGNVGITGGGVVTGITAGTATVSYIMSSGCKATTVVTVSSSPASITGTQKVCPGTTTTLSSSTTGGTWTSSDASLATVDATTGVVTGVTAGTLLTSYGSGAGCYRTAVVTVNAAPAAITGATTVCIGSTTALASATTPGLSWTSSNTSVATINTTSGLVSGIGLGTATITYTLGSGCTATTIVTVTGAPSAIGGPASGCVGADITLTNAVSGGAWSSSNTATATIGSSTGVLTGVAYGNTYITYSLGGSCYRTKLLTVNNQPTVTGYPVACVGTSTTLSASAGGTWATSNATVANLTSATAGYVQGIGAGNATITFTASGTGCIRNTAVTVNNVPAASTGASGVCVGSTATLSNATAGGSWSSSNGATASVGGTTGIVTGMGMGAVNITYSFGAGCRTVKAMTVNQLPAMIGGTTNACLGLVTTLSNVTPGGTWSSSNATVATVGTGASAAYGAVTGVSLGTATISFTIISTGCLRSAVVTVNASPNAGTITGAIPLHTTAGGGATSVTLSSTGDAGGAWTSSNTARATVGAATGLVSAVTAGTATITYSVTLGACTARATQLISITSPRPGGALAASAAGNLQLYPNPTTGEFTVVADEAGTLQVYTIDGREVTQFVIASGINPLSLPKELAAGVYMCRYDSENGNTTMIRLVHGK
ncbi:MAG: Ig-like domain-containing protein [Bacteroidota bacterium]